MADRSLCWSLFLFLLVIGARPVVAQADPLGDLPLHLVPAEGHDSTLAVLLTGDGNWADIDEVIATQLVQRGVAVVGVEARSYLNHGERKTPELVGHDLERILRHYLTWWNRSSVIVIGYSRGAELAPFALTHLPVDLRRRVRLLALLAPAPNTNFTFHLTDLLSDKERKDDLPMLPEIAKLAGTRILCVYGTEEKTSLCPMLPAGSARVIAKTGGHHLDKDFAALATLIYSESLAR